MAEKVAPAAGDERDARLRGVEQRFRRRAAAAVMRDFENVAADVARGQLRFLFALGVAGEERAPRLDLQPQHDRAVVLGRMFKARRGDECGRVQWTEGESIAVAGDVNRRRVADARGENDLRAVAGEAMRIDPDL